MGLFGQIVGAMIEVVKLPVSVAVDALGAIPEAGEGVKPGSRVRANLEKIKKEAKGDDD